MQKHVNLVDLVKSFPTNVFLQNLASIQKRTSPVKFAHLAEKSGKASISNPSTKVMTGVLYPMVAFAAWHPAGILARLGFKDFAGGVVVHAFGGSIALASAGR